MWPRLVLCALACAAVCVLAREHQHHEHDLSHFQIRGTCPPPTTPTISPSEEAPVARSEFGTFRGSWMETRRGRQFQAYRGIRYAEPPVGELRFKPPKMMMSYKGEVDASEEGPACPLVAPPSYYVDEDCLTLNVYTPNNNSSKKLPVIFYIHPGGFYAMTGRSDLVGPHYLLDRDVVLVAINYRLGSLGWMSTGDKYAPGNNGMKDQVAALKWVQRNIAAFGGDPNLVTIAGCSAGAISVMLHMISPMSKGLFHRGISMSGSPITKLPTMETEQRHLAVKQAEVLNCPTTSSAAIVDCLMKKPWRELGDYTKFFEFGPGDPVGLWGPVVEPDFGQERFLSIHPLEAIKKGKMHEVPYIVCQTTDEFFWKAFTIFKNETLLKTMNDEWDRIAPISFMLPKENATAAARRLREAYLNNKKLEHNEDSRKGLANLYRDSIIGIGVHRLANLMSRHSRLPVYYQEFAYFGNNSYYEDENGKPQGASHHDDTLYLFSQSYRFPTITTTSPDSHVVDEMTALWYNFARHGDPNPRGDTPELGSLQWPAMKPSARKYLHRGDQLVVRQNMFEERFKVWEELYPIDY
ncbi:carboxylic ester hydrolase-like [Anticarsia gemmatalis]|uniref:carboxylic ester hydrolase-like n=1 Tax=Anticarsia gemmatalis TaxID=129554 RepID=UPI003F76D1BA